MALVTVLFCGYFLFLFALLAGWRRRTDSPPERAAGKEPLVSVIVPVRNEEKTISFLLRSLQSQDYRNFEVIIVNDDSEDETLWMVNQCGLSNVRVIHSAGRGKKAAITQGLRAARGTIIATTDADCVVPRGWVKNIREAFLDADIMLVFGGVRMEGTGSFFDSLQQMEFASLIGTGAATASLGFPTMCNGANLAFRRKVFSEVKGYEGNMHIPSGDDEFLLRKVQRRYPGNIRFLYAADTVVTTATQPDLPSFVNQRIRWASKWKHNSSLSARGLAVLVFLFQALCIANWIYLFTPSILQAIFLISLKIILEAAFLLQVCRFLEVRWKWLTFFALQGLYPPYVIAIGVASFFRPFEWKRRIFRPK